MEYFKKFLKIFIEYFNKFQYLRRITKSLKLRRPIAGAVIEFKLFIIKNK